MKKKNIVLQDSPGSKEGAIEFLRKLSNADAPLALVQDLGAHDLLLAMREADDEQRADLLTLSSKEQFDYMVDFSCWHKSDPDTEAIEEFIEPLVLTGIGGSIRAIDKLDGDLRTLLFKNRVVVHLREDKDEDFPDVPDSSDFITTPDGYYGIEIPDQESCPDVVKELVRALIFKPFEAYQAEFEAVRHEFKFELMEESLRWRNARLADLGFGSYEEGRVLLAPIDAQIVKQHVANKEVPYPLNTETPIPAIYREHLFGSALLDESVSVLQQAKDEKWQARAGVLNAELSAMVSLFLTAIHCDLADLDAIAKGTELARDILGLGLNAVAKNPQEGAKVLAYQSPGRILQVGMGVLVPLRQRAGVLAKSPLISSINLENPWQIALDCLRPEIPKWWPYLEESTASASMLEPLPNELVPFQTLEQINAAGAYLDELAAIESFLNELKWKADETHAGISLSTMLLTLLANAYVDGRLTLEGVSMQEAQAFSTAFLNQPINEMLESSLKVLSLSVNVNAEGPLEPTAEPEAFRRLILRLLLLGRDRLESESFSNSILTA